MDAEKLEVKSNNKGLFYKIRKIALLLLLFLLVFSISITIFINFHFFRTWALSKLLIIANNELIAKVEVDDLYFSPVKGIILKDIKLITAGDTLANVEEINLMLSFSDLMNNKINVYKLKLINSKVRLLCNSQGIWNYDQIAPPSSDTNSSETKIKIYTQSLILQNADFLMYDSTSTRDTSGIIDFSHFHFTKINLDAQAIADLASNNYKLDINNISLVEKNTYASIKKLKGTIGIDTVGPYCKNLNGFLDNSEFEINAKLGKYNVFGENTPDIENADMQLKLKTENFDPQIVNYFYIMPIKIGKIHNGFIDIDGNLNDLDVSKLNIISNNQEIFISGKLKDIPHSDKFTYNLNMSSSNTTEKSLSETLPKIDLTSLPRFDKVLFKQLHLKGNTKYVEANFDLLSTMGNAEGKVNFTYDNLQYETNINFQNLDISKIINNKEYESKLNGSINAKGINFEFNKLLTNIELNLANSQFRNLNINQFYSKVNINNPKIIQIDTFNLRLNRINEWEETKYDDLYNDHFGTISLDGNINFTNIKNPIYNLQAYLTALDINQILDDDKLPDHLTAKIQLNGQGINIDSLRGDYKISVDELLFKDRAVFPFEAYIKFESNETNKNIILESDLINAQLKGKFVPSQLISGLSKQGEIIGEYIESRLDKIKPDFVTRNIDSISVPEIIIRDFPYIDGEFNADIKDLSIINTYLDSLDINSEMYFNLKLHSNPKSSSIKIDSLNIQYLKIENRDFIIQTNNLKLSTDLLLEVKDSAANFNYLHLNIPECNLFRYNNTTLYKPQLNIELSNEIIKYSGKFGLNENLKTEAIGQLFIKDGGVDINVDKGNISYQDSIKWEIANPFTVNSYGDFFKINNFNISRHNFEKVYINGVIKDNIADNLKINIKNLVIQDIINILDKELYKDLNTLALTIDTINIDINGNLDSPNITLLFESDSLYFNKVSIGTFNGRISHKDNYITGNIISHNANSKEVLKLDIVSLPIYLGLDTNRSIIDSNRIFDVRLNVDKLSAGLLQPFASGINNLKGDMEANILVDGYLPNKLKWGGNFNINKGEFWVDNTNIKYLADAKTEFQDSKLFIRELTIKNRPEDLLFGRIGSAEVTGYVNIDNFKPGYMDLKIKTDRLLALSEASNITMPELYGNFIMTTDENPLRFYGTLKEPNLDGDINVMYADIKMPLFEKRKSIKTTFNYQLIDNKYKIKINNQRDTNQPKNKISEKEGKDLLDLLNMNLRIKLLGQFGVKMDMELIGEMNALIGTPDKTVPLIYKKSRNSKEASLFGDVIVKEQSIIKSLKQFNTYGNVSFPTGTIENPTLDLVATHTGTSYIDNIKSQYLIKMYITGTKLDPKVKFQYFIDGVEGTGSQEQINEDALYLLALGRIKSSVSQNQGNNSLLNEGLVSGFSNFANKALSELLASTGVIQSAALDFRGGSLDLNQATVKFSGQLYGGISWTFGGSISDISGNNEITLDIPASEFLENPFWSNFIFQLTKASSTTTIVSQDAKNWEVKVKFGNSW